MKTFLHALGLGAAMMIATGPAFAYDITSTAPVNVSAAKIAMQSYDPVAYFTVGKPVLGSEAFSAEHEGAIYRFSSEEHMKAFKADPARYAPQHGGFCRMGVALGKKLDGDPTLFRIDDGKLAVFSYPTALKGYVGDVQGNGAKADANWPEIKNKAPSEL